MKSSLDAMWKTTKIELNKKNQFLGSGAAWGMSGLHSQRDVIG
jgi:hypothetical protein